MNAGFVRLHLRRALPLGFALAATALAVFIVGTETTAQDELALVSARALSRASTWSTLTLVLVPYLIWGAARTISAWREGEVDWIAKAPVSRLRLIASAWCGASLAAALVVAGCACAAEFAARGSASGERRVAVCDAPPNLILDDAQAQRWTIEAPARDECSKLRLYITIVAIEPSAFVQVRARRANGGATIARKQFAAHGTLDIETPPGAGQVELEIARVEGGAIVMLARDRVDALLEGVDARQASLALAARITLALAAWLALALGLGAWLSAGIATWAALALTLPALLVDDNAAMAWLPWHGLGEALELCERGVVPEALGLAPLVGSASLVALGLALGVAGTRTWRKTP